MKQSRGFTLVELLAVIAILATILLIVVPMILGTYQEIQQEGFRDSIRNVFHTVRLYNAETGITSGSILDLDVQGDLIEGTWKILNGKITLTKVRNQDYCVARLKEDERAGKFTLSKDCSDVIPYKEVLLHGADPVLKDYLVPITISKDGTVRKADLYEKWYNYSNKEWANAVILVDKTKEYEEGSIILEEDIESYFVWIPRYKYKIFDEGSYTDVTEKQEGKEKIIEIVFESQEEKLSTGSTIGEYLTHPAFTSFDVNGLWVGKFELGYKGATTALEAEVQGADSNKIIVKPNVYSWRNNSVRNFFEAMYQYNRSLDSHMIKNTEWGAVAYLAHSEYGLGNNDIGINNYKGYVTGCGDAFWSGETENCNVYTSENGMLASTTGNVTGIYDMSGGSWEYVAGYRANTYGISGFDATTMAFYDNRYFDKYHEDSTGTTYQYRILGDATGEMGPFYYVDYDQTYHSSWFYDYGNFLDSGNPWFIRGGGSSYGTSAGLFNFIKGGGFAFAWDSTRLVLAPKK